MPVKIPARAIFFGSGGFAVPILEALVDAPETEVVAVVTAPDRPAGRGQALGASAVAVTARRLGLDVLQPVRVRGQDSIETVVGLAPALGILADYGQLIPEALLDVIPAGILNVHPSLLPRHRGASPVPAAIMAGDAETGVTIFRMDAGLDSGPIVAADRRPLTGSETTPELEARLASLGAGLLRRTLGGWLADELREQPQDSARATLTRPLSREDGRIDPGRPARELERQVRAYQPWPGSFLDLAPRLIVWKAAVEPTRPGDIPGQLVQSGDAPALVASDGRLQLVEVQPAGGRRMSGAELLRGRPRLIGAEVRPAPA